MCKLSFSQCVNSRLIGSFEANASLNENILSIDVHLGESYCKLVNLEVGKNYTINVYQKYLPKHPYIYVRKGAPNGQLLASGKVPLTYTPTSEDNVYIHFVYDQSCDNAYRDFPCSFGINTTMPLPVESNCNDTKGYIYLRNDDLTFKFDLNNLMNMGIDGIDLNGTARDFLIENYKSFIVSLPSDHNQFTFSGSKFMFESGGKLITEVNSNVTATATVLFNNCTFSGACGFMWKGIFTGGHLTIDDKYGKIEFNNCTIKDAEYGINIGRVGCFVNNVNFVNNVVSIYNDSNKKCVIEGCNFASNPPLNTPYPGQELLPIGDRGYAGIYWDNERRSSLLLSSGSPSTFDNLSNGIIVRNNSGLSISNQIFKNFSNDNSIMKDFEDFQSEGYGIVCDNCSGKLSFSNNKFNEIYRPLTIQNTILAETIIINKNKINCLSTPGDIGIRINNAKFVDNITCGGGIQGSLSNIYGFSKAISMENIQANFINIIGHQDINLCNLGIYVENVKTVGSRKPKISLCKIKGDEIINSGIFINRSQKFEIYNNEFDISSVWNPRAEIINLYSFANGTQIQGNQFNVANAHTLISSYNNRSNSICCNAGVSNSSGLLIQGTNPLTKLKANTFENTGVSIALRQTQIGEQKHHGNRWQGANSSVTFEHTDVFNNLSLNKFTVNPNESNSSDGLIRPMVVNPIGLFENVQVGASNTCAQFPCDALTSSPPSIIEAMPNPLDEPCFPDDTDSDQDGICDSLDPDPLDACVPNNTDTDHDGICDGIDPDPYDGCNPIHEDRDGDGICDNADTYPNDPCLPYASNQDGDGLCDQIDPAPNDGNIPAAILSMPAVYQNPNGEEIYADAYDANLQSQYSFGELEALAVLSLTNHAYEDLNEWDKAYSLVNILDANPYFMKSSAILKSFYLDSRIDPIKSVLHTNNDLNFIGLPSKTDRLSILKNRLYAQRLSRLVDMYTAYQGDTIVIDSMLANMSLLDLEYESFKRQSESTINEQYLEVNNAISSLPQSTLMLEKTKEMMRISSKVAQFGKNSLSFIEINALHSIASLCPLEIGGAVYDARLLLVNLNLSTWQDYDDDCIQNRERKKSVERALVSIYPNPSSGLVHLIPTSDISILRATISDALGNKIMEIEEVARNIDLSSLESGVYYLTLDLSNKEITTKKIIHIK